MYTKVRPVSIFFSLATVLLLSFGLSDNGYASTPTENSATVDFDVITGTTTMTWDFGDHPERDYCIVKTEVANIPYFLSNGDPVDPVTANNATKTSFLGTNTSTVYANGMNFDTIQADSAKLADATISCQGSLSYTIPDRFIYDDFQLFMTFGEVIKDENTNIADHTGAFTDLDTIDYNDGTNLNTLHEITVQYSNYIEFAPVQCYGDNRWEIGTEYFKDIYTEDTKITFNAKEVCDQRGSTGGTTGTDGQNTQNDNDIEIETTEGGAFPTEGTWYLVFALSTSDSGGCGDCTSPTLFDSQNREIVQDGFRYNGQSADVIDDHVEILLITNTNQTNFLTLKVYDNSGTAAIEWIDVGFGYPGMRASFDDAEVTYELKFSNNTVVENKYPLINPTNQNLIDFVKPAPSIVNCGYENEQCLQVTIPHIFRDNLMYDPIIVRIVDESGNSAYYTFNYGIVIQGESINKSPTDRVFIQKYLGNPEYEWVTIDLIDRVNDIWVSDEGLEFKGTFGGGYQRIIPLGFDDSILN